MFWVDFSNKCQLVKFPNSVLGRLLKLLQHEVMLSLFDLVYFKELKTRTKNCASYRSPMTTTKEKPTVFY